MGDAVGTREQAPFAQRRDDLGGEDPFGDEESVAEIALGFTRWREQPEPEPSSEPAGDVVARLASLEAENRVLRGELTPQLLRLGQA